MKRLILTTILTLICFVGFAQSKEYENLDGSFKITKIDSLKSGYLINAVNDENLEIVIWEFKPKKKCIRKLRKDSTTSKIRIDESYTFKLSSMTTNIGYYPTSNIIMDGKVIWTRDQSNFFVYETKDLTGLYYKRL